MSNVSDSQTVKRMGLLVVAGVALTFAIAVLANNIASSAQPDPTVEALTEMTEQMDAAAEVLEGTNE